MYTPAASKEKHLSSNCNMEEIHDIYYYPKLNEKSNLLYACMNNLIVTFPLTTNFIKKNTNLT